MIGITVDLPTILEKIEETFTPDHILEINTNGICGIVDISGKPEICFNNLDELFKWVLE